MPIEVYIAMSYEQSAEEHGSTCIEWELPDSKRIYFDMIKLPAELVHVVKNGWEKEVAFPEKGRKEVRLLGWGD